MKAAPRRPGSTARPDGSAADAPIRVLIAEDHALVRRGMVAIVDMEEGTQVVGEAADGAEALAKWRALRPDVMLVDLRMPELDGLDVIRRIHAEDPRAAVVVLTTFDHEEDVYGALKAGAKAYLLKDVEPDELFRCIRAVHVGEAYLQPKLAAKLAQRVHEQPLTDREVQILGLVAKGLGNKAIAATLFIGESTVKTHLKSLFHKLDVTSRSEAVAAAARRGLVRF
ncbi:MAG: response regulator transcription factor [Burkholderiales bacterium]|jgi:two-component system NarL family response regulator|nr:response regulator transcription factor [Burkholderiales bacterium]